MIRHPAVALEIARIVDESGTIRYVRLDEDYWVRPSIGELLEALAEVRRP